MRGKVRRLLKQGFTIVELIVVVAVMTTLMGIAFPLLRAGDARVARNRTVDRLQRLQNCLSGYHAAFGHYPEVPLHASRDYHLEVNNYGIQTSKRSGEVTWRTIRGALMAQPVTVEFPFDEDADESQEDVTELSRADVAWAKAAKKTGEATAVAVLTKGYKPFVPSMATAADQADWRMTQMYRHGLLAYLLPRAQFMADRDCGEYAQWTEQNDLASYYDAETGKAICGSWSELVDGIHLGRGAVWDAVTSSRSEMACASWLPNLAGSVQGGRTFYGVDTSVGKRFRDREEDLRDGELNDLCIHAPGTPESPKNSSQYVLDGMTVLDGWGTEFFYYSPYPHRICRIWSAGRDRKTFPPWVDPSKVTARDERVALEWTRDDITASLQ